MKDYIQNMTYLIELLEVTCNRDNIPKSKHIRVEYILRDLAILAENEYFKN